MAKLLRFASLAELKEWATRPKATPRVSSLSPRVSEDDEQMALIARAQLYAYQYPALSLLIHIPNGGKRHIVEAKRFRALGVKAGMPDLILFYMARGYGAWCGELKAMDGKIETEQRRIVAELRARGYFADFFFGQDAAWASLMWYLEKE